MESKEVVGVVLGLDAGEALVVCAVVRTRPVGEARVGEVWEDAARSVRMDERPGTIEPVGGGDLLAWRGAAVEDDRMLEQEAFVPVNECGRVRTRTVVRAAPRCEVELARLTGHA